MAGSEKFGWECKILDGSGKVWLGVVKFGWVYIQRFGWVWILRMVDFKGLPFLSYFLSFWLGVGKFGWVWLDVAECGWVWLGVAGSTV